MLFRSALGLFGLAWYSVESRMKEIGLRKINGATQRQVVGLLCIRFIKWIAIALAIGLPMALYLIEQWRMQYVFRPQLTLCTGKVLMNFGEEQLKLTPGEQLVLDKTNMHLEREHVNTQNYML